MGFFNKWFGKRKQPDYSQWEERDICPIDPHVGGGNFRHPSEIISSLAFRTGEMQHCGDLTNKAEVRKAVEQAEGISPAVKQAYFDEIDKLFSPSQVEDSK